MSRQRLIKYLGVMSVLIVTLTVREMRRGLKQPSVVRSSTVSATTSTRDSTDERITTTTNALVVRAVDGDTLIVRQDGSASEDKVRLLGVNTPESVDPRRPVQCFGKEASHFTATMTDGKRIRLESDPQADERDKYGRLLRNVVLEDGTDFNAQLISEGYAYAYVSFPQNAQRKRELKRLQAEAQAGARGLWNSKTCAGKK